MINLGIQKYKHKQYYNYKIICDKFYIMSTYLELLSKNSKLH